MPGSWRGAAGRSETQTRIRSAHCRVARPAGVVYLRQNHIGPGLMDDDGGDGARFL